MPQLFRVMGVLIVLGAVFAVPMHFIRPPWEGALVGAGLLGVYLGIAWLVVWLRDRRRSRSG